LEKRIPVDSTTDSGAGVAGGTVHSYLAAPAYLSRVLAQPGNAAHVQVGNMLLTMTDYINSRASNPEIKAAAADAGRIIKGRL
jgi:hypothetical protein